MQVNVLKGTLNTLMLKHNTFIERDSDSLLVRMVFPNTLRKEAPTFYLDLSVSTITNELTEFEQYQISSENDQGQQRLSQSKVELIGHQFLEEYRVDQRIIVRDFQEFILKVRKMALNAIKSF